MNEVEVVAESATTDEWDCAQCKVNNDHTITWMNMMRDFMNELGAVIGLEGKSFSHFGTETILERVKALSEFPQVVRDCFVADIELGEAQRNPMPGPWREAAARKAVEAAQEVNDRLIALGHQDIGTQFPDAT